MVRCFAGMAQINFNNVSIWLSAATAVVVVAVGFVAALRKLVKQIADLKCDMAKMRNNTQVIANATMANSQAINKDRSGPNVRPEIIESAKAVRDCPDQPIPIPSNTEPIPHKETDHESSPPRVQT